MKARSLLHKIIILAVIALFALIFSSVLSYAQASRESAIGQELENISYVHESDSEIFQHA